MSDRLTGDPAEWLQVLGELEERNVALSQVGKRIEDNTAALAEVRQALAVRPTGDRIEYRRRRSIAGLVFYGLLIIFAHDQHVENCGPGARVEHAVEQSRSRVSVCDVSFPLHGHERGGQAPSAWALLGGTLYAVAGAGLWAWVRKPRRDEGRDR